MKLPEAEELITAKPMEAGRIDRLLRSWGVATRRETRKWVSDGRITVNGVLLEDPNFYTEPGMELCLDGKALHPVPFLTVMMNKPAGYICVNKDKNYPMVKELLADREPDRGLFPIGRLDTDTEGLLLLSTNGDLGALIARPEYEVPKTYHFTCDRPLPPDAPQQLEASITSAGGEVYRPAKLKLLGEREGEITVTEGKYHEVKRLVHALGPYVATLKRIAIGNLRLDETLHPGEYRALTEDELRSIFAE